MYRPLVVRISQHALWWGCVCSGGVSAPRGVVSSPRGCLPLVTDDVCSRGCLLPVGGCLLPGGVCSWGVPACGPRGVCVYPSMQWGRPTPVKRMTDRCKNITLPQTSFAGVIKRDSVNANRSDWTEFHYISRTEADLSPDIICHNVPIRYIFPAFTESNKQLIKCPYLVNPTHWPCRSLAAELNR